MILDELTRTQLIATAELARAAVAAGIKDAFMFYLPGDAPCVTRQVCHDQFELCADGEGKFDVWQTTPLRVIKFSLSLSDAVVFLGSLGAASQ